MRKMLVVAGMLGILFASSCKKQELVEIEPQFYAPTMSFQKSSSYSDQTIVTPDQSVLLFEGRAILKNAPVYVQPTVTILPADPAVPVTYASIKNVYVTISGIDGSSNKKNPTQAAMEFDPTPLNYDGTYVVRVYGTVAVKMKNSIMCNVSFSYSWDDPTTGKWYIEHTSTVKGQTISFE